MPEEVLELMVMMMLVFGVSRGGDDDGGGLLRKAQSRNRFKLAKVKAGCGREQAVEYRTRTRQYLLLWKPFMCASCVLSIRFAYFSIFKMQSPFSQTERVCVLICKHALPFQDYYHLRSLCHNCYKFFSCIMEYFS